MNENVKKVFEMLGLEPNEEFKIEGLNGKYKLNSDLQILYLDNDICWFLSDYPIVMLLENPDKIIKQPKLSEFEIAILKRCLEKGYVCIARDEGGDLYVYDDNEVTLSPDGIWKQGNFQITQVFFDVATNIFDDDDFSFIKEKSKYDIAQLLNDCGVPE